MLLPKRRWWLLLLLLLGGCGPQLMWTKPGFNSVDWQRDNYECERDTRMSRLSFGDDVLGFNQREFFSRCLQAKGYALVRQQAPSEPYTPAPLTEEHWRAAEQAATRSDPAAVERALPSRSD